MNKKKSSGSRSRKQRLTAVGTHCADHVTPLYPQKLAQTSPTGGGRSVGIVRSRTKATEFSLVSSCCHCAAGDEASHDSKLTHFYAMQLRFSEIKSFERVLNVKGEWSHSTSTRCCCPQFTASVARASDAKSYTQ